jgi:hypothetical protein
MIIRHGEKPGNPATDTNGGPNLSVLGSARAAALPSLFTPDPTAAPPPTNPPSQLACDVIAGFSGEFSGKYVSSGMPAGSSRFPPPNFLFATEVTGSSNRPVETITPLSQALASLNNPALNTTINSNYPDDSYQDLATLILSDSQTYGGQVILICWHHGKAPNLAQALGVPKSQLTPWDPWQPTVFDLVFQITWDNSGQANLVVGYQQLLFADTAQA